MSKANKIQKDTAWDLLQKSKKDNTSYDALEVGHAVMDDVGEHLRTAIENYRDIIDEEEFCVVMLIGKDNLLQNVMRRKFYCWPYLPKPRPNQSVFLYNKGLDKITKRLWVLPCDMVMSELASLDYVHPRYQTMQRWSKAFFAGCFWHYIREEHGIDMLSEHEYLRAHRKELMEAGCKIPTSDSVEPFDFGKIEIEKFKYTEDSMLEEEALCPLAQT